MKPYRVKVHLFTVETQVIESVSIQTSQHHPSPKWERTWSLEKVEEGHYATRVWSLHHDCIEILATIAGLLSDYDFPITPEIPWGSMTLDGVRITDTQGETHTFTADNCSTIKENSELPDVEDGVKEANWEFAEEQGYIYALSPVDIFVKDSEGRRTGALYEEGERVGNTSEILGSNYSESMNGSELIIVPTVEELTLTVIGVRAGTYGLGVLSVKGNVSADSFESDTSAGEVHTFDLTLKDGKVNLEKRGEEGGEGGLPIVLIAGIGIGVAFTIVAVGFYFLKVKKGKKKAEIETAN